MGILSSHRLAPVLNSWNAPGANGGGVTGPAGMIVDIAPPIDAFEGAGSDLAAQLPHVLELSFSKHPAELGLDPEEPGDALLLAQLPRRAVLRELEFQPLRALVQKLHDLVGMKGGKEGERRLELGVLIHRRRDEVRQPVVHLDTARVGQVVDGALGKPAGPLGALGRDETSFLE